MLAALLLFYPQLIYDHGGTTQPLGLSGMVDQKVSRVMVVNMGVASTVAGWVVLRELGRLSLSVNARRLSPEANDGWSQSEQPSRVEEKRILRRSTIRGRKV